MNKFILSQGFFPFSNNKYFSTSTPKLVDPDKIRDISLLVHTIKLSDTEKYERVENILTRL